MDFFHQPCYKLSRNFARLIGRWPYQSSLQCFMIGVVIIAAYILQVGPKILADIVHSDDQELVLETLAPTITNIMAFAKYINTWVNAKMLKKLFETIKDDWELVTNSEEKEILKSYAEFGKLLATGYAGFVYITTITFVTEPVLPILINSVFKTNLSAPHKFADPMEWIIIDKEKYYWILLSNSSVCIMVILSCLISYDVIFITFVHHACGLFALTGHRIQNLTSDKNLKMLPRRTTILNRSHDFHYKHLISCIKIHKLALNYVDLIETTFSGCFGMVVGLNLPLMSITGVQIIAQGGTLQQKIKYVMFTGAQMLHLFFECFLSQRLTDMSFQIQEHIANGKWYNLSPKSQKLLILMTMRSQVPCILTAGKIMGLSIKSFGMMLKTSGSYFTMLLSFQN
ncbi:GSCOCT00006532001.3-RA-CDS [Cotesia congregata]|uniref:Odorant receptor n=1 Tax=Cotesia congregata TaxID=51543 RepID=A0A8J2HNJ8_COTCN|nr:GSCOCT00006532001.3-RA-CDS [Cotesia congregata]CAG5106404.1 olfactory receptor 148 [Cotesia congregata]